MWFVYVQLILLEHRQHGFTCSSSTTLPQDSCCCCTIGIGVSSKGWRAAKQSAGLAAALTEPVMASSTVGSSPTPCTVRSNASCISTYKSCKSSGSKPFAFCAWLLSLEIEAENRETTLSTHVIDDSDRMPQLATL